MLFTPTGGSPLFLLCEIPPALRATRPAANSALRDNSIHGTRHNVRAGLTTLVDPVEGVSRRVPLPPGTVTGEFRSQAVLVPAPLRNNVVQTLMERGAPAVSPARVPLAEPIPRPPNDPAPVPRGAEPSATATTGVHQTVAFVRPSDKPGQVYQYFEADGVTPVNTPFSFRKDGNTRVPITTAPITAPAVQSTPMAPIPKRDVVNYLSTLSARALRGILWGLPGSAQSPILCRRLATLQQPALAQETIDALTSPTSLIMGNPFTTILRPEVIRLAIESYRDMLVQVTAASYKADTAALAQVVSNAFNSKPQDLPSRHGSAIL